MTRWAMVEEARRTWRMFRDDFIAIPRERRKRFALTLTWGWVAAFGLALAMSLGLRAAQSPWLEALEQAWLVRIVDVAPFDFGFAVFLESPGNGVVLLPLVVALAVAFVRRRRPLLALGVLAACLMMAAVVGLGWLVWDRPRPEFLYDGGPGSGLSAFPSGHTAMAIPTYGLLTYLWLRRSASRAERAFGILLLLAVLAVIVLARLVLSAHWPSDVLAGGVLGLAWLAVLIRALRRAERPPDG